MNRKLKKIICLLLVTLIAVSPVLSLASETCCTKAEKQAEQKIKCHDNMQHTKKDAPTENSMENCNCDCGMCKVTSFNLPKVEKLSQLYSNKVTNLVSQVSEKKLSYGIFTPPKFYN